MNRGHILVIDDDSAMRDSLKTLLQSHGFTVDLRASARDCVTTLDAGDIDTVLCDVRMPGMTGLDLLKQLGPDPAVPLVLMSAHGDIAMAVQALHDGAFTFFEKPFEPKHLLKVLDRTVDYGRLKRREGRLRQRLGELVKLDRLLLGESEAIVQLRDRVIDIADSAANVLIIGETGTGKELVSRGIHDMSSRADGPFVAINCALASTGKFDATLFGERDHPDALFQQADGGTLFLDEVDAMPLSLQAQVLRTLETGEFLPLGAAHPQKSDFRLISAAGLRLEERVERAEFRADLLFRINTVTLELPPLRSRGEDIVLLYHHFLAHFAALYEVELPETRVEDIATIMTHPWPGNVRELRSVCERQILLSKRGGASLSQVLDFADAADGMPETLREAVATFERQIIAKSLLEHEGRMDDVATALGIGRRTLNEKIVKLGLDKDAILGPDKA